MKTEAEEKTILPKTIPFFVHEAECSRLEKIIKRLWILVIILIALLVATNAVWIWYESRYEDVYTEIEAEQEADNNGRNIIVGGDFFDGEAEGEDY